MKPLSSRDGQQTLSSRSVEQDHAQRRVGEAKLAPVRRIDRDNATAISGIIRVDRMKRQKIVAEQHLEARENP